MLAGDTAGGSGLPAGDTARGAGLPSLFLYPEAPPSRDMARWPDCLRQCHSRVVAVAAKEACVVVPTVNVNCEWDQCDPATHQLLRALPSWGEGGGGLGRNHLIWDFNDAQDVKYRTDEVSRQLPPPFPPPSSPRPPPPPSASLPHSPPDHHRPTRPPLLNILTPTPPPGLLRQDVYEYRPLPPRIRRSLPAPSQWRGYSRDSRGASGCGRESAPAALLQGGVPGAPVDGGRRRRRAVEGMGCGWIEVASAFPGEAPFGTTFSRSPNSSAIVLFWSHPAMCLASAPHPHPNPLAWRRVVRSAPASPAFTMAAMSSPSAPAAPPRPSTTTRR